MLQFRVDHDVISTADEGWRDPATLAWGVIHSTESNGDAAALANWQANPANGSSYNVLIGLDGQSYRENDDDYSPYAARATGNRRGLHVALMGKAAWSTERWHHEAAAALETLAQWIAHTHRQYGWPLRWLTVEETRNFTPGYTTHANISLAFHESDHTDPGDHFPYEWVMERAKQINGSRECGCKQ